MKAELIIPKRQLEQLMGELRTLRVKTSIAGKQAMAKMASDFRQDIRDRYLAGHETALAVSTTRKRAQGKRKGKYPAISPGGAGPLHRTGRLAQLVQVSATGSVSTVNMIVRIRPGIRMQYGGSTGGLSDKVASALEFGATRSMELSARAQYYLIALATGAVATGERLTGIGHLEPKMVTITIPPRPIWVPALQDLNRNPLFGPKGFVTYFMQQLSSTLKLPIVFTTR